MAQEIRTSLSPKALLKGRLLYRLNFAAVLNTPESEFAKLIADLEQDPFVQKLFHPKDQSLKIISRKRYPNTRLSSSFYEIDEGRVIDSSGTVDVQSLLSRRKGLAELILKIGRENFEKYFLYRDEALSPEDISRACGITADQTKEIISLLLDLSIHSEFFHPSTIAPEGALHYTVIARIDLENDRPVISYLSPHLAGGRYMVNRDRLTGLKKTLTPDEKKKLKDVLSKIDWINLRQDTMQKIVSAWVLRQEGYLRSGAPEAQLPFTQRNLSAQLKLAPSTISRALFGKSVILPWNQEKPLKDLFMNKRSSAIRWVSEILESLPEPERKSISDSQLKDLLQQRHKLKASRRSVNLYRRAAQNQP